MKNEWTEQDLRQFVESSRPVFQDVSLTQVDEDADRCWQDDGLMVDYELRGGQVDCVLRRCVVADGKVWQLQMTAPLAGNDLPEDRMTPREREMCRDDMNHDFVTGVFNRRYYETEFCTKLDEWTDSIAVRRWRWCPSTAQRSFPRGRATPSWVSWSALWQTSGKSTSTSLLSGWSAA